jgi:predicted permease
MLPVFIWDVITALGNCSIPIGLILIGASFYELSGEFKFSRLFRVEVSSLLVRNVLFPMMAIICLYFQFLPTNMPWVQEILLIQSAMPAGIFAVVIVGNYGGDKLTALRTIPVTMIAGMVTLPFWVFLGLQIIE